MLYQCTFPVVTSLFLKEQWPIYIDGMTLEWVSENGIVKAVSIAAPMMEGDELPKTNFSAHPGVPTEIHLGGSEQHERMEHALRTIQGTLAIFAHIDIDFDQVKVAWIPESDDEKERLRIPGYTRRTERAELDLPRTLQFETVALSVLSVNQLSHFEIPLEFLRRGVLDLEAGRYIESFYSLFFFLETLYAPGFSDPRKVKAKLYGTPEVIESIGEARRLLSGSVHASDSKMRQLIQMNDEKLIDHIVTVRGNVHHHALPRPGIWHPGKPDEFKNEVIVLRHIAHGIAATKVLSILYSDPQRQLSLFESADVAGAILSLQVTGVAVEKNVERQINLGVFKIVGRNVTKRVVNNVNLNVRDRLIGNADVVNLKYYRITSLDGRTVYAVYDLLI